MMYYYLVNGQRIEIEHVCYSTTTGQYYGRPSETWVVGTQPGHTRRSVLLRPADCDAYHGITEQDLYCRIEAAMRILAQYREIANTNLEPLLRDLRRHVHLLYLLAEGDPDINWVDTTSTRDIHSSNVYRLNPPPNITPTEGGGNDDN